MNLTTQRDWDALATLLHARGLIEHASLTATRLTGGQSNPTFLVSSGTQRYVLRMKPVGQIEAKAHAIDREYRVMHALQGSDVPVPAVYLFSEDLSVVGSPFYLMEYLDGRVLVDQSLPGMQRAERGAIYAEMNRVMAALHRVDVQTVGLADYSPGGNHLARQIASWTRQCRTTGAANSSAMQALMNWLPRHIPADDESRLVHGDFRLDNLVFHSSEPKVIGVLDWELSALGHPLVDFAYHCLSWHIPPSLWRGIAGLDLAGLGIPTEETYMRWYLDANGMEGMEHWDFYIAYNLFRLAAILFGIAERARHGNAAAGDATETGRKAGPMADLGWHYAMRYEAGRRVTT
ncbi:phosphotransferase [Cupriavidus consociatus]|uniref:phosphotransferase n=1 Tax=Cupriavidus consociatus TaxID=2821357 RepID=UPI001AEA72A8|nr:MULTISPECIES: phosphotransferase [unclassified Cupriavidus]MBP0625065.1 phosphotransferase [Cupriavidus sp. LEh25]MDK2661801.1 phosphotransferase [Cupriavidus sp. LEh21]